MGVPLNVAENIDKRVNYHHPIPKGPLSWGISNMALTKNKMNNKVLLKYVKLCYIRRIFQVIFISEAPKNCNLSNILIRKTT